MPTPALTDLVAGLEGWDAVINDNNAILRDAPLPIAIYADFNALPTPSNFIGCIAYTTAENAYWKGNTVHWMPLQSQQNTGTGHRSRFKSTLSTAAGMSGATINFNGIFPTKVIRLGVTLHVSVAITGATTFDVGDGTDVDRYGAAIAIALDTVADMSDATADPSSGGWNAAAGSVILTANGSSFTGGTVVLIAHYMDLVAPTV